MSLVNKLSEERRARLAMERLLELKQAELSAANRKLGRHALALTKQIGQTQAEVATVRDENERVKFDLTIATEQRDVAERRFWQSIQTIQDGFAFFDEDGLMIGANNAYISAFDGLEEIAPNVPYHRILQLLTDEGLVNLEGENPRDWRARMTERWQSEHPEPVVLRWWNDQYIRLIDQRGQTGDTVCLALDITENVRYEERLKAERFRAESANRAKSAFLANMSHEIRTPMNGVVGMAELLGESPLDQDQRLYVDTIKSSAEALLVIINDVLDYSKIEADKLELHPEAFDLERTVYEVATLLQSTAQNKDLKLVIDYDMFLPTRYIGDPGRVRQILINIMANAVKFTHAGHVLVRVTGFSEGEGGASAIHITVEDTGVGIPESKIDHIFGEFNQVDDANSRSFEGTGLGLAITKRLIEMMQGSVWVESTVDVGTCVGFRILLDLDQHELPDPDLRQLPMKNVVIVDPDKLNRDILEKQLNVMGVSTEVFQSGHDLVTEVDGQADAIICNYHLPDMTGVEMVHALRNQGLDVPVVMAATGLSKSQRDAHGELVSAWLIRPCSRAEMVSVLATLNLAKPEDDLVPAGGDPAENDADASVGKIEFRRSGTPRPIPNGETPSPVPDQNTDALAADVPPPTKPEPETSARKMRILAAEDNKTNQLVFRKMVKDLNIDLRFANDGEKAVEAYQSFDPDLVFMDISMPRMDGKQATKAIRQIEKETGRHVPIVALTAHAMKGDEKDILSAGLDYFLTKPLRKALIVERIQLHHPEGAASLSTVQAAAS